MAKKKINAEKKESTNLFQKLSLFSFSRRRLVSIVLIIMVTLGLLSYTTFLKREGFPPIQTPIALTTGVYLVDDPAQVDKDIAKPATDAILQLDGVTEVNTTSDSNFVTIASFFDESVTADEAEANVNQTIAELGLPNEAQLKTSKIEVSRYLNEYNILLAVYATEEGTDLKTLNDTASEVADFLGQKEGIVTAAIESPFTEGVNPLTGESGVIQSNFSRYGKNYEGVVTVRESVIVGLAGEPDTDIIDFSENVDAYLLELKNDDRFEDISVVVAADFAPAIENQIQSLQSNLLTGLLAVSLVTFLLITWRASVITAIFMLSVVAVTLLLLYVFGYTLNVISLFALVLALGLFVDDATIIVEAIDASKSNGRNAYETVKYAISKVGAASFAGTMTTVLVFLPLVFVSGILGSFIRILPITIIIALLTSLVLSLVMIPILSRYLLLNSKKKNWSPLGRVEEKISGWISSWPLVFRKSRTKGKILTIIMIGVSFLAIQGAGYYATKINFNIFPPSKDSDQLQMVIEFRPGATISEAEQYTDKVNEIFLKTVPNELIDTVSYFEGSNRSVNAFVELIPFTDRDVKAPQIIEDIENAYVDYENAKVQVNQIDAGPPSDEYPFKVQIITESPEEAMELADAMTKYLQGAEVERQNGTKATITRVKQPDYQIVSRNDGVQYFELQAGFDANDTSALVNAARSYVEDGFEDGGALSGYSLNIDDLTFDFGQESENADSFSSLGLVFPIALAAMYILLAVQFRSLLQPLLIFVAIPFSIFGVMAGLYYTDNPISFFVMVGFFGLIGIAVNNTILLTDYANQEKRSGKRTIESISEATRKRFRPLVTTSLTTVFALLPLALSDPFWESLAFTIIFGLLSSTLLVVLSFPYYYLAVEWFRMRISKGTRKARKAKKKTS